ncbi:uncharacterized protein LOC114667836 isoform X3 [Erpetoichthys calabaricus]|uniref:uncharacterized protein LOC114667836 isoform X3 n=1 Tax=Erpetoichthys calabaricus TaxID=27687 RepID=UPI002234D1DE|nr:uncharacterized protein LOC114667836 isoform X3 [Erpetoichthys calabaricus]
MADVDASAGSPAVNDCSIELDCVAQPPSLLETVPDVQIINADGVEIKVEQIEHGRSEGVDSDADHESTVPRSVSKEPNPGVGTEIKVEEEYMEVKVCEVGESSEDGTLCKQEGASNDENNSETTTEENWNIQQKFFVDTWGMCKQHKDNDQVLGLNVLWIHKCHCSPLYM